MCVRVRVRAYLRVRVGCTQMLLCTTCKLSVIDLVLDYTHVWLAA